MHRRSILRPHLAQRFSPATIRQFHATARSQQQVGGSPHVNFYRTHGRALFKALTLAFFSYQCFYWAWITLESETIKDDKNQQIKSLQGEIRLLEEGKHSHKPGEILKDASHATRLLDEKKA